jgi:hypothetical protein
MWCFWEAEDSLMSMEGPKWMALTSSAYEKGWMPGTNVRRLWSKKILKRRGDKIPPCNTPRLMKTLKLREGLEGSPTMQVCPISIPAMILTESFDKPARRREVKSWSWGTVSKAFAMSRERRWAGW